MNQSDETLIKLQNEISDMDKKAHEEDEVQKEIDNQSIFDNNITVYGLPIKFSSRQILDGKAKIHMPTDFEELDQEEIAVIYPLGNKPQAVYGNTYFEFSIGFNHTQHNLPDTMMVELRSVVKALLEKAGPKIRIFKEKELINNKGQINETKMSTLEFTSHTLTDVMYNMMFFTSIDDRVLIGFINFSTKNLKRHQAIATEVIKSFEIIKGE